MGLLCMLFGHKFNPPVMNSRGANSYKTCRRCKLFLVPDYFDGWQRASKSERALRIRAAQRQSQGG